MSLFLNYTCAKIVSNNLLILLLSNLILIGMGQTITEIDFSKNDLPSGYYVINNAEQYDSLINPFVISINLPWRKNEPEEETSTRGRFNFEYDLLVGVNNIYDCSTPTIEIKLISDNFLKKYEIVFHIWHSGGCRKLIPYQKWHIISGINKRYDLAYTVRKYPKEYSYNED